MKDLQKLILEMPPPIEKDSFLPYGNVRASFRQNLILFNYNQHCVYEGRWNWFERVSRGLIIDATTAEVVARPFDKFFNWGEKGQRRKRGLVEVQEKLDGSLAVLYRLNGDYHIATRGSFHGDQAVWASEFLQKNHGLSKLPDNLTLLFEIIYPENRIVVDYEGERGLRLIGVRDRFTGEDFFYPKIKEVADQFGFGTARVFEVSSVEDFLERAESLSVNEEGWVLRYQDGMRLKVKGKEYLKAHKIIYGLSEKAMIEAVCDGKTEDMLKQIPEEFRGDLEKIQEKISLKITHHLQEVNECFLWGPKDDRKAFALYAQEKYPKSFSYIMSQYNGKDIEKLYSLMYGNFKKDYEQFVEKK